MAHVGQELALGPIRLFGGGLRPIQLVARRRHLFEVLDHPVKCPRELADFVPRRGAHFVIQITGANGLGALVQSNDRPCDHPGSEEHSQRQAHGEHDTRERQ